MRGNDVRVLVVGAGIAGLAAARTLHVWGAEVNIVERAPAPRTDGTGIYLPGNAVRALNVLGLGAQVTERAVRIERQRVADHRGRLLLDLDVEDLWAGVGPCLALPRAQLHQVLLAGAADVAVQWGRTPEAIDSHDGGGVTVRLSDATTGRYDLVLGADGLHSAVRRMAFAAAPARPVGQYAHRFVVAVPNPAPVWSARLGPGSSLLTIPIGPGMLYCYTDGPPGQPPPPLRDLLAGYAPPVPALLDALEASTAPGHAGPIEEVVLDSWSRRGVLLIGDAAHATSPNMAQGAAMALEDAIVLAECLTTAHSIADAVTAYETRRRPRTDWVLRQTHRRDRTRNLIPAVRNLVLKHVGRRIFQANYRPLRQQP